MSGHGHDSSKSEGPIHIPHGSGAAHSEEGEGNWLVSYADMMTLLVGFFVILLSFSSVDSEKMEALKRNITQQFGGTYQVPYGDMADRIRTELEKLGLGEQFIIKNLDDGIEISFLGAVFFETGSVEIREEGHALMEKLTPIVLSEAKDFNIVVEGHTDDVPVASSQLFRNNWELSSLRACRVLEMFAMANFDRKRLTAVGYGDTRPIVPNRDAEGNAIPRNQTQNRRVVVKVLKRTIGTLTDESKEVQAEPTKTEVPKGK